MKPSQAIGFAIQVGKFIKDFTAGKESTAQPSKYDRLIEAIERAKEQLKTSTGGVSPPVLRTPQSSQRSNAGTQCRLCNEGHLTAASADLDEGLRMARQRGIQDPEVQDRLYGALQQIVEMERYDYNPEKVLELAPWEREMIHRYMPQVAELRHDLQLIQSIPDLEKTAAKARVIARSFFSEARSHIPEHTYELVELSRKVKAGELTLEEAKEEAKKLAKEKSTVQK